MFSREEMIDLRERAEREALCPGLNPSWARAYLALADAADHLDAMITRCTERVDFDPSEKKEESSPTSGEILDNSNDLFTDFWNLFSIF